MLLGVHRAARALIRAAGQHDPELLKQIRVIDFNPETLRELNEKGVAGMFGDLSSFDTLEHAHLHHAKVIVSTIPDMLLKGTDNQTLVKTCRADRPARHDRRDRRRRPPRADPPRGGGRRRA